MKPRRQALLLTTCLTLGTLLAAQAAADKPHPKPNPTPSPNPAPSPSPSPTASPNPAPTPTQAQALQAYAKVYAVLLSPRCMNCHPVGDAPLQGDDSHVHTMNVSRLSTQVGLACQTCHRAENASFAHGPPGIANWRLPDAEMPLVFQGKSPHDLCVQMKDPARNGHRTLAQIDEHMEHDPLVAWGWHPGVGRTLPPFSHEDFAKAAHEWVTAGGPCP